MRRLKCGRSVYCACQAKGSRGPAAATAPQLRQEALCTAPATQKGSAEAEVRTLCVLRLPGKRQPRASGGHRAAAPPESSVYCACHAQGKCGGSVYCAGHARRSSSWRLCVLRVPHERRPGSYLYSEWMSEWVSQWASEWVSQWVSEWVMHAIGISSDEWGWDVSEMRCEWGR